MTTALNTSKETKIYTKNKQKFVGTRCSQEDLNKLNKFIELTNNEITTKSEAIRFCIDYCYSEVVQIQGNGY